MADRIHGTIYRPIPAVKNYVLYLIVKANLHIISEAGVCRGGNNVSIGAGEGNRTLICIVAKSGGKWLRMPE
jgi:hypothetical protein